MPFADPNFPSSDIFDAIAKFLSSPSDRKSAIKQTSASFGIKLKNDKDEIGEWTIDLKNKGEVASGIDAKPTVTLALSETDFGNLVSGTANAQKLFMAGKIKISGDMMKATKLEPVLKKIRQQTKPKAKL